MDTPQWAQGIGVVKPMESGPKGSSGGIFERRARPVKDQALNCPRCNSTNTKFCYYNNYSLSQPRYFCKTCRRYWTEGGSLRNVPVGGGSRKNKRSTPSSSTTTTSSTSTLPSSKKLLPDLMTPPPPQQSFPHHQSASQNPKIHQAQDLNLAYPPPPPPNNNNNNNSHHDDYSNNNINSISSSNNCSAAMELLKSGIASSRGLNSFMPMSLSDSSNTMYSSAGLIPMQEFKPSTAAGLNFSLEGFENGYGAALEGIHHHHHHHEEDSAGARVLFPVEDLKQHQVQSSNHHQGDSTGYCWNGMLGGGSW